MSHDLRVWVTGESVGHSTDGLEPANSDQHDPPATATDAATPANRSDQEPRRDREPRPCSVSDPMLQLVYHNLDRQYLALDEQIRHAVIDGITAAAVHGMRTASRRMRATLKVFRELLPRAARRHFTGELAWFAGELGRVRDLDVQCTTLEHDIAAAPAAASANFEPYLARLRADRELAVEQCRATLCSERAARMLGEFAAFLAAEPSPAALRRWADLGAREGAMQFALRARKRLRKLGRRAQHDGAPAQLHGLRIRCKRFRYLLECFDPVCGDRLRRAVHAVRKLQDTLGRYQDAHIAKQRLADERARLGTDAQIAAAMPLQAIARARDADADAARGQFHEDWRAFERRVTKKKLRKLFR